MIAKIASIGSGMAMSLVRVLLSLVLFASFPIGQPVARGEGCCSPSGGTGCPEKYQYVQFSAVATSICPYQGPETPNDAVTPPWSYTVTIKRHGGLQDGQVVWTETKTVREVMFQYCTEPPPFPVTKFVIVSPSAVTKGTPFDVEIIASDPDNRPKDEYEGEVQLSSSDPNASFPEAVTLRSGRAKFKMTMNTEGSQTVRADDNNAFNPLTGTSDAILVNLPLQGVLASPSDAPHICLPLNQEFDVYLTTNGFPEEVNLRGEQAECKFSLAWTNCIEARKIDLDIRGNAHQRFSIIPPGSGIDLGKCSAWAGSANLVIGMGGGATPALVYEQHELTANSYGSLALSFVFPGDTESDLTDAGILSERPVGDANLERISVGGWLLQARSREGLATIDTAPSGRGFRVRVYRSFDTAKVDGLYVPQGAPVKTVLFENPGAAGVYDTLQVTEDGRVRTFFDNKQGVWTLTDAGAQTQEVKIVESTLPEDDPHGVTYAITTHRILDLTRAAVPAGNQIISERSEKREQSGRLLQTVEGPADDPERVTTTYHYDDPDHPENLLSITRSDGYFEYYQDYAIVNRDTNIRQRQTYSAFKDLVVTEAFASPRFTTRPLPTDSNLFDDAGNPIVDNGGGSGATPDTMGTYNPEDGTFAQGDGFDHMVWGDNGDGTFYRSITNASGWELLREDFFGGLDTSSPLRTRKSYDGNGNLLSVEQQTTGGWRTLYAYTYSGGHQVTETDEKGVTTTFSDFDGTGRPLTVTRAEILAATNLSAIPEQTTKYAYDGAGRMLSKRIQSGGQEQLYTWAYNRVGRLTQETTPFGSVTHGFTPANVATKTGYIEVSTTDSGNSTETTHYLDGGIKTIKTNGVLVESHNFKVGQYGIYEVITKGSGDESETRATNSDPYVRVQQLYLAPPNDNYVPSVDTISYYDASGRLVSVYEGTNVTKRIEYSPDGNTQNVTLYCDPDPNRVTTTSTSIQKIAGAWWRVTTVTRPEGNGSVVLSKHEEKLSGFGPDEVATTRDTNALGGITTSVTSVDSAAHALVIETRQSLVGNSSKQYLRAGLLEAFNTPAVQNFTNISYDGFGRETKRSDPSANNGDITTTYDPVFGLVSRVSGGSSDTIVNEYYPKATGAYAGLLKAREVNGLTTRYSYTALGQLEHVWGASYPLTYSYDAAGRMKSLATYRYEPDENYWFGQSWPTVPNDKASMTTWLYWPGTPFLKIKQDAAQNGPTFLYNSLGKISSRTWSRGVVTTYTRNLQGELNSITYNDGTPSVSLTRDANGFITALTDGAGKHQLGYNLAGQLISETGLVENSMLSHRYDVMGRPIGYTFIDPTNADNNTTTEYAYHQAKGVIQNVVNGGASVQYEYEETGRITSIQNGPLTTKRTLDANGRLAKLETALGTNGSFSPGAAIIESFEYGFAPNGQQESVTRKDGTQWKYSYDRRSQVIGGVKHSVPGGVPIQGYNFAYAYDAIGNRTQTQFKDTPAGYSINSLNENERREVPNRIDLNVELQGSLQTLSGVALSVNAKPVQKEGEWFTKPLTVNNAESPVWQAVEITAVKPRENVSDLDKVQIKRGHLYFPRSPEAYSYDLDGNVSRDGRWTYHWDAENRLSKIETLSEATAVGAPNITIEFFYDSHGRRVRKSIKRLDIGSGEEEIEFVYNGWNLISEYERQPSSGFSKLSKRYGWALDQSSSLERAGGVGGLMLVEDRRLNGVGLYRPIFDCRGNIMDLWRDGVGEIVRCEYGPFGEQLRQDGDLNEFSSFGFSTKYYDKETGLNYYGLRYFEASLGRWVSRDPFQERGGKNLYGFVNNNPVKYFDPIGLLGYSPVGDMSIEFMPALIEYRKTVRAEIKRIARTCRLTMEKLPGMPEIHETTWNIETNFTAALVTLPGALEIGQVFVSVKPHRILVRCNSKWCHGGTVIPIRAHDVFEFPNDDHNFLLYYLGGALLPSIPRSTSIDSPCDLDFGI